MSPFDDLPPQTPLGENHLLSLIENANDPIWVHTLAGQILEANKAACERYGYPREAFLQLRLTDLVAPECQESFREQMKKIIAQGHGRIVCSHVRKDRTVFSAEVSVNSGGTDQGPLFMGTVRSVNGIISLNGDSRMAIQQPPGLGAMVSLPRIPVVANGVKQKGLLEATCRRYASALDQATEVVAILDAADGTILYSNAAFSQTLGNPSHWAPHQQLMELFEEDVECRILAAALEQVRAGHSWTGRSCLKPHAGKRITFEGTLTPVRTSDGAVESLIVRLRDITLEVEKDRHLREAQRLGALGALAGGVAHDFNNLIAAILGAAELIKLQIEPYGPIWRKVEIIRQVGGRAKELTTQILNFDRRNDAHWTPIDFTSLVTEVTNLLQTTLPGNVKVRSDLTQGIRVIGDPSQLHQVLMNLGINGSQAMQPDGGILSIQLQPAEADSRGVGQLLPEPYVRLTVEDSGCGMDPRTLERIFEPFFTTKAAGEGTGLGLSVVHGIIQGHGGNLQVSSKPGQGSSFQIFLPVYQDRRMGLNAASNRSRVSVLSKNN